jgi:hypothetical protein
MISIGVKCAAIATGITKPIFYMDAIKKPSYKTRQNKLCDVKEASFIT